MSEKQLFSKDELLGVERPSERFTPTGYNKAVRIRALNALEQSRFNASMMDMQTDEEGNIKAVAKVDGWEARDIKLCAMGLEEPQLTEEEVGTLPNDFVKAAAERIRELSGMNQTVEEAEGN